MIPKSIDVDLVSIHPCLKVGLNVFEAVYKAHRDGKEIVVTATRNGSHMVGSLHYEGKAADIRANDIPKSLAYAIRDVVKYYLDKDFDIIAHGVGFNFHFHIEYDPK